MVPQLQSAYGNLGDGGPPKIACFLMGTDTPSGAIHGTMVPDSKKTDMPNVVAGTAKWWRAVEYARYYLHGDKRSSSVAVWCGGGGRQTTIATSSLDTLCIKTKTGRTRVRDPESVTYCTLSLPQENEIVKCKQRVEATGTSSTRRGTEALELMRKTVESSTARTN